MNLNQGYIPAVKFFVVCSSDSMVDAQFTTRLGNLADLPVIEAMLFEAFFYPDNWRVSQQKAESTETLLLIPDQA